MVYNILCEETVKCNIEAVGVGVHASREGFSEITTGKSYFLVRIIITKTYLLG